MSKLQELIHHCHDVTSFETDQKHTWCSGCGNYGILNAMMRAFALEELEPHEVIVAFDVGCSGNLSDKFIANTVHGLHGRVLPLAAGAHCANPEMPVVCLAGDGATMSEGVNHLIHAARNNYNITFLLHNNHNYGLTTGQASATTPKGCHMQGTAGEVEALPLEPIKVALSAGGTFAARGFSGDVDQLTELIREGMHHQGFSLIEILQHCPTYAKSTPLERYEKRIYKVSERDDYDVSDKRQAMQVVENIENLATGVLYKDDVANDFLTAQQSYRKGMKSSPIDEVEHVDVSGLLFDFVV